MLKFIIHRFLLMIPTLLGVAVLVFFLLRLMPGDPVATMLLGHPALPGAYCHRKQ